MPHDYSATAFRAGQRGESRAVGHGLAGAGGLWLDAENAGGGGGQGPAGQIPPHPSQSIYARRSPNHKSKFINFLDSEILDFGFGFGVFDSQGGMRA